MAEAAVMRLAEERAEDEQRVRVISATPLEAIE
jgi:hypothetical protein